VQRDLGEMTGRRRVQEQHNERHGITPRSIVKSVGDIRFVTRVADARGVRKVAEGGGRPADAHEREALIQLLESQMRAAAEGLDFEQAALLRDQLLELKAMGLIEWPERAGPWAPPLDRHLRLSHDPDPAYRVVEGA